MPRTLAPSALTMLGDQDHVITRGQALALGWTDSALAARLAARRWQRLLPGVYLASSAPPTWAQLAQAAVLYGGPGAVLSHQSAAVLHRLGEPGGRPARSALGQVVITVPAQRRVRGVGFVQVRRSRWPERQGALEPAHTPLIRTVLDLFADAATDDAAIAWLARAFDQHRCLNAADLLAHRMAQGRMPRRALLRSACGDVADGARSPLEWRYLRQVERAHRLPAAARQVRRHAGGGSATVSDVEYLKGALVVELDGRLRHAGTANRWRDLSRDNAVTVQGARTLRYGWHDVVGRPCQVAAQVATVLAGLGWGGSPTRCGNQCAL